MSVEPRNAATQAFDAILPRWSDRESVLAEWHTWFAEDFVREDRRRLVAAPTVDAAQFLDHHLTWFDMGQPRFELESLAVRGERLSLTRVNVVLDDAFAAQMLGVARFSSDVTKIERMVLFDVDDVDSAAAELDAMHAEIESSRT